MNAGNPFENVRFPLLFFLTTSVSIILIIVLGCSGESKIALGTAQDNYEALPSDTTGDYGDDSSSPTIGQNDVSPTTTDIDDDGVLPDQSSDVANQPIFDPVLAPEIITEENLVEIFGADFEKARDLTEFGQIFSRGIDGYTFQPSIGSRDDLSVALSSTPEQISNHSAALLAAWDLIHGTEPTTNDPPIVPDETSDATSDQTDPPDDRTTAPQEVISERKLSQIFGKDFHAATNLDEFKQVFSEVDGGYIFNPAITTKGDLNALLDKMPDKIKDHSRGIKDLWDIIYL